MGDDFCPAAHVGQPAKRTPGNEDAVEAAGSASDVGRLIHIRNDKAGAVGQPNLLRQHCSRADGSGGKIDAGYNGAALRQRKAVHAEMALQMQDPHAIGWTEHV